MRKLGLLPLFLAGAVIAQEPAAPGLMPIEELPPPPVAETLKTDSVVVRGQTLTFALMKFPDGMVCQSYIHSIKLIAADAIDPLLEVSYEEICDEPQVTVTPYGNMETSPRRLKGLLWVDEPEGLGRHAPITDTRAR